MGQGEGIGGSTWCNSLLLCPAVAAVTPLPTPRSWCVSAPDAPGGCGEGCAYGRRPKPDLTKEYVEKGDSKPNTISGPCATELMILASGNYKKSCYFLKLVGPYIGDMYKLAGKSDKSKK